MSGRTEIAADLEIGNFLDTAKPNQDRPNVILTDAEARKIQSALTAAASSAEQAELSKIYRVRSGARALRQQLIAAWASLDAAIRRAGRA